VITPDENVLLLLHWMSPDNVPFVIEPVAEQLRAQWPGRVIVAYPPEVQVWLDPEPRVVIAGEHILPALVYARLPFRLDSYPGLLTLTLQQLGATVVNSPQSAATACSKHPTALCLAAAGLPIPAQTLLPNSPSLPRLASLDTLGWPQVIKHDRGSHGLQVALASGRDSVDAMLGENYALPAQPAPFIAQQFRADAAGRDLRVVVTGGHIAGAVERRGPDGDFRSNLYLGGSAHPADLTSDEAGLAVAAADAIGLTVAGVDLLRTDDGPMVTEVNATPGMVGVTECYGPDVYRHIAAAVINSRPHH